MSDGARSIVGDRFILLPEMKEILRGYSEAQIRRLEKDGTLPPRRMVTKRRKAWLESDVREWMRSRPKAV